MREAKILSVTYQVHGEIITAVLRAPSDWTESALKEALVERLPKYKIPRIMYFVDDIAKNSMGKVNKSVLKQLYSSKL